MDISKLDPTLQGVIIGSILSLVGNFLLQLLAFTVDNLQWKRKRKAEKEDLEIQARKNELERVRNIYVNCISRLSLLSSSFGDEDKYTKEELERMRNESFEWVSLLKLHRQDLYSDTSSKFYKEIENYMRAPEFFAGSLLAEINKIFVADKLLFPNTQAFVKEKLNHKIVQIYISDKFRREQIINGVELPKQYTFQIELSALSEGQREILWDTHYGPNQGIPDSFWLAMPKFINDKKKIDVRGKMWEGNINPLILSSTQIFDAWEKDYLSELSQIEQISSPSQNSDTIRQ